MLVYQRVYIQLSLYEFYGSRPPVVSWIIPFSNANGESPPFLPELEHDLAPVPIVNPHVQSFLLVTLR